MIRDCASRAFRESDRHSIHIDLVDVAEVGGGGCLAVCGSGFTIDFFLCVCQCEGVRM